MKKPKPGLSAEQEVLTLTQAAQLLQLCNETVSKYASDGEIPGRKIGTDWRFLRSDLLAFIHNGSAKKTA